MVFVGLLFKIFLLKVLVFCLDFVYDKYLNLIILISKSVDNLIFFFYFS